MEQLRCLMSLCDFQWTNDESWFNPALSIVDGNQADYPQPQQQRTIVNQLRLSELNLQIKVKIKDLHSNLTQPDQLRCDLMR